MQQPPLIVRVAIPTPLSRGFDYLLDSQVACGDEHLLKGKRVEVPFGRTARVGVILCVAEKSEVAPAKLKRVTRVLDTISTLPPAMMALLEWASRYYHCPIGEAVAAAVPAALRKLKPDSEMAPRRADVHWRLTCAGKATTADNLKRAPLQQKIVEILKVQESAGREALAELGGSWRQSVARLCESGLIETCAAPQLLVAEGETQSHELNAEQQMALTRLQAVNDQFQTFLLEGVTGSGKTEVYLRHSATLINREKQVLVLVPEIGLTPQLMARFHRRFGDCVVALHSGLSDGERLRNWQAAASGKASIVIGTRSSVFTPFASLGLIIVDEEHDPSLKQQDGFRYHARDLALVRARDQGIPVILGSATPSLETLHNALTGRYTHLKLPLRAGDALPPTVSLLDVRRAPLNEGLCGPLVEKMRQHIGAGNQVLLFINRRGFAPVMLCDDCDATVDCLRCDAHMTVHLGSRRMRCHHCGSERPVPSTCDACGGRNLVMTGQGTERIDYALRALFPSHKVVRIDRDTTRNKGSLKQHLEQASSGEASILVGTQMLAKGHHFPGVTLVAMLDVDRGLYGVDFRAAEQMAQTIVQVAGRAGRELQAGEVLIQTRSPDNPLFQEIIHNGYTHYAKTLLEERRVLGLPPYSNMALLRARSSEQQCGYILSLSD